MDKFREITPNELSIDVMKKIGGDWMLLAAEHGGRVNMMTASWGGLGVLWHKPVSFTFFRPSRYTLELVNASGALSMCFFDESFRGRLEFCGANSGRDFDKVKECGFEVLREGPVPYFAEANRVFICKRLYVQQLDPACFTESGIDARHYPQKDYHYMIVSEIMKILER